MTAATTGLAREERLMAYRRIAMRTTLASSGDRLTTIDPSQRSKIIATEIEDMAHAMLAAERPADAPARDVDVRATVQAGIAEAHVDVLRDLVAAQERTRALLVRGIRKAIAAMESVGAEHFPFTLPDLRALLPDDKEAP